MVKARKLRACSSGNKEKEDDRISELPDELIHYIMSFIDTKYAVQTSVLSKRWIHIWKSLPFLNFNRNSFSHENAKMFADFVYMVFLLRDNTNIQKFNIVDWGNYSYDNNTRIRNVNRWWLNAVQYNVQEITIRIDQYYYSEYEVHRRLLNCKSLTKLEMGLWINSREVDIIVPRSMNLPRLKELTLHGLSISNVESSKRLFSSCPVLESLLIVDNRRSLIVDSLSLKEFEYCCSHGHRLRGNDTRANINIKLCTPNLELFIIRSFMTQDFSLEVCSTLPGVNFDMFLEEEEDETAATYEILSSEEKDVYAKRMMKFLGAVYMVKDMKLSPGFLEVLSRVPDLLDCQPIRLCNLQQLVPDMWFTRGCLRGLAYLLSISPNIAEIYIISMESNLSDVRDDWDARFSSPQMLSHLKYVAVKEVEGCDAELKLLRFMLEHAKVLVEVNLSFRSCVDSPDRVRKIKRFKKKLRAVPTASSNIEMVFN